MREPKFFNPLVVGYRGEIGSFILSGLLRTMPKALNIWCFDINETESEKVDRIKKADVIFLCVPLQDTVKWLSKYRKLLKNKTIIEQTSLKSWIDDKVNHKLLENIHMLSMHILFRPSATPVKDDRKVILIGYCNWHDKLYMAVEEITEAEIVWITNYKLHDNLMAYQQALIHRVLLTLDKTLLGLTGQTYIGKKIKELTDRIRCGDPKLYSLIQKNKYLHSVMETFNRNLKNFKISKEIK